MKLVFSTAAVPRRDRFDYWHSVACQNVIKHDSRPHSRPDFHAELRAGTLAGLNLVEFSNAAMSVAHTDSHASQADPDEILICRQSAGSLIVKQDGHEILLNGGDLTLLDPRIPYVAEFSPYSRMLVIKVPRRSLDERVGALDSAFACALRSSEPESRLASTFLASLPDVVGRLNRVAEEMVSIQALDLISLALRSALAEQRPTASGARSAQSPNQLFGHGDDAGAVAAELATKINNQEISSLNYAPGILSNQFPHAGLTARERVVLAQLVRGYSSKEIARALNIAPRTVEFHRANLLRKTGARNTIDLVRIVTR